MNMAANARCGRILAGSGETELLSSIKAQFATLTSASASGDFFRACASGAMSYSASTANESRNRQFDLGSSH